MVDAVVLTAIGIGALIGFFPTTGPAMNPMLATTEVVSFK